MLAPTHLELLESLEHALRAVNPNTDLNLLTLTITMIFSQSISTVIIRFKAQIVVLLQWCNPQCLTILMIQYNTIYLTCDSHGKGPIPQNLSLKRTQF